LCRSTPLVTCCPRGRFAATGKVGILRFVPAALYRTVVNIGLIGTFLLFARSGLFRFDRGPTFGQCNVAGIVGFIFAHVILL